MNDLRPIDWRLIDDINKDLDHLERTKRDPNSPFGTDGPMKVEQGQVLRLQVRVTDPELAQVVLGRSFVSDEGSRIPGMAIESIIVRPDVEKTENTVQLLRRMADLIENDLNNELHELLNR